jgi:hypothetical protein
VAHIENLNDHPNGKGILAGLFAWSFHARDKDRRLARSVMVVASVASFLADSVFLAVSLIF